MHPRTPRAADGASVAVEPAQAYVEEPGPRRGDGSGAAPGWSQAGRTFIAPPPAAFFLAARSSSQMVKGLAMYTLE